MSKYKVDSTSLTAIADAIRAKTGKSASMEFPSEFVSEIGSISGGGSGQQIGVETPKANLLAMLYQLEQGTAKTGTFTLATTLPNTVVEIFNAEDTTVKNFAIFAEDEDINGTGTTNTTAYSQFILWLESSTIRLAFSVPINCRNDQSGTSLPANRDVSIDSAGTGSFIYAKWDFVDGVLSAKADYNKNGTYTPFVANVTYRWVAW